MMDDWTIIRFPAIAEDADVLGRQPGDCLWPERYNENKLEEMRKVIGSRWWSAQFQQRPAPAEGNVIKREYIQYYETLPEVKRLVISWDMSFKEIGASYVVGQLWGLDLANRYLIKQIRQRMDFAKTLKWVERLYNDTIKEYELGTPAILVEDAANGPAIISALRKKIPGIIPVKPQGSKEARVEAILPLFEAHNVFVPGKSEDDCPAWVQDCVEEWVTFPVAANDDQVDAMSQALQYTTHSSSGLRFIVTHEGKGSVDSIGF